MLAGTLIVLGNLDNLASLNVSYNNFSGFLPDTKFFHDLPSSVFIGNPKLCINKNQSKHCESLHEKKHTKNLIILVVITIASTMIIVSAILLGFSH
ncbi:hypothetical protein U1Q18_000941 [Sarracenia purpurea var. burkii]